MAVGATAAFTFAAATAGRPHVEIWREYAPAFGIAVVGIYTWLAMEYRWFPFPGRRRAENEAAGHVLTEPIGDPVADVARSLDKIAESLSQIADGVSRIAESDKNGTPGESL